MQVNTVADGEGQGSPSGSLRGTLVDVVFLAVGVVRVLSPDVGRTGTSANTETFTEAASGESIPLRSALSSSLTLPDRNPTEFLVSVPLTNMDVLLGISLVMLEDVFLENGCLFRLVLLDFAGLSGMSCPAGFTVDAAVPTGGDTREPDSS